MQRLQLKIGTKSFDRFTKVPIPLTVKFYLFNITNAEQVLQGNERPKFEQVGPFMYKQWRRREIIDIIDNNRRVVYKEFKTFFPMFEQRNKSLDYSQHNNDININDSKSNNVIHSSTRQQTQIVDSNGSISSRQSGDNYLNPSDFNVTIVNVPLLSVLTKIANLDEGLKLKLAKKIATNLILDGKEKILISKRASEILFDGYKVALMEAIEDLVSTTLGFNYESPLYRNKFGFFYMKNDTWKKEEAGEMTVFTGRNESMNDFMLVDNWNGLKKLQVWPENTVAGDRCNQIRGSDGSQFHPGVTRQQVLSIFSPMICTSLDIHYKSDTSAKGIPLLRFSTASDTFGAPKKYPKNACYCTIADRSAAAPTSTMSTSSSSPPTTTSSNIINQNRCYLDGLLDLSLCQKGAPIAASSPHFFQADPMLAMAAGLEPNASAHQTYLDIEPMTGAVMRAASRAQLNAFVESAALNVIDPQIIGHMTPMVAPLLWLEESAEIDNNSANEFKSQLLNKVRRIKCICTGAIIIGIVALIVTSIHWFYYTCYKYDARKRRAISSSSSLAAKRPQLPTRRYERREKWAGRSRAARQRRAQLDANLRQASAGSVGDGRESKGEGLQSGKGVAAVAIATAMGAADAAVTRHQRQLSRRRSRRADYEDEDSDVDAGRDQGEPPKMTNNGSSGDDESSKQALVSNEWPQATTRTPTTTPSSAASSLGRPTGGATSKQAADDEEDARDRYDKHDDGDDEDDDDERRDLIGGPMTSAL